MKLTIIAVSETGKEQILAERISIAGARRYAVQAAHATDRQIYITGYRASDGQQLYVNRDGYAPIGRAW